MKKVKTDRDEIPVEFATEEEAGRFWDAHDSAEFLNEMDPVEADVRMERRIFEIEVDEEVIAALRKRATKEHVSASGLANTLLRKELAVQ